MFSGDEFTLEKFKAMIDSEADLSHFKQILSDQKENILHKPARRHAELSEDYAGVYPDIEAGAGEEEPLSYLPATFEGMMESFGINLQRKNLYGEYYKSIDEIERGIRNKDGSEKLLCESAEQATDCMRKIIALSIADPGLLKNQHNQLFLKLMSQIDKEKELKAAK